LEVRLVRIAKVTSNDGTPLVYLPKPIREVLGLEKGVYVKMEVKDGKLIIEPLKI